MRNAATAEWILKLVSPPDRAVSTIGDLLEESSGRGPFWFWCAVLTTAASHVAQDFWVLRRQMLKLGIRGLLANGVFGGTFFAIWTTIWRWIAPYHIDFNSTYIPPWTFFATLIVSITAAPFYAGWHIAGRSNGHELASAMSMTSLLAFISIVYTVHAGSLVTHVAKPYPYEQNYLIVFFVQALFVVSGSLLSRLRSQPSMPDYN